MANNVPEEEILKLLLSINNAPITTFTQWPEIEYNAPQIEKDITITDLNDI